MNAISVEGLTTAFGERVIHDSISFCVKAGEIFTIIGSSGAGKSTILKEIVLLSRPQAGKILVFNEDVLALHGVQKRRYAQYFGFLFQSSALFSSLSVGENIAVVLREYTAFDDEMIDELVRYKLSLVGLAPFVYDLFPSELSGGMKKRAALARALALEPRILFLDEPTSGLDPISSREFDTLIVSLKKQLNITFVVVSHDPHSVTNITDTLMVLDNSRIAFIGSMREAFMSKNLFIQSFFDFTEEEKRWNGR